MPLFACASHKRLAPFGQRRADALLEYAGVDSLDVLRRGEIAVGEARKRAVPAQTREKRVERIAQFRVSRCDRPGEFASRPGGERDVEIKIDVAGDRCVARRDDGVIDRPVGDLRNQRVCRCDIDGPPLHLGVRQARSGKRGGESGVGRVGDSCILHVRPLPWPITVTVVDQHWFDRVIPAAPGERRSAVSIGTRGGCGGRLEQATGAQLRLTLADLGQERRGAIGKRDVQRDATLAGETGEEIVIEAGRLAIRPGEPRRWTRPDDDIDARLGRRRLGWRPFAAAERQQRESGDPDGGSPAQIAETGKRSIAHDTPSPPSPGASSKVCGDSRAAVRWRSLATGCENSTR